MQFALLLARLHLQLADYTCPLQKAEVADLEDGQLHKMQASPLYKRERQENSDSSQPIDSGTLDAIEIQKRRASAQRTQADHLRRESLMSSSPREPRASGKLYAMFPLDSEPTLNTFSTNWVR